MARCGGTSDARLGREERHTVQLCELRGAGSEGSSVATDPSHCRRGTDGSVARFRAALRQVRPAVDPAREIASRSAAAGLLFGALGGAVDGATRLQSAVPLVCWAVVGHRGVGRECVHQEPRAPDRGRHCSQVHGRGSEPGAGQSAAVGRPFLGRRHADRGVGEHEELSSQRRQQ